MPARATPGRAAYFAGMMAAESAETDNACLEKARFLVLTCEQRNTPWV